MMRFFIKYVQDRICRGMIAGLLLCLSITTIAASSPEFIQIEKQSGSFQQSWNTQGTTISVVPFNCPVWGTCMEMPILHFSVQGLEDDGAGYTLGIAVNDREYYFDSIDVKFPLPLTFSNGSILEYWFENEDGKVFAKNHFYFRLTILSQETGFNRIELLGYQWQDSIPIYALAWNIFPPLDASESGWEIHYESAAELATSNDLALLAGQLIWNGTVHAGTCSNGGLETNGAATPCGMDAAYTEVVNWQNAHDEEILLAAQSARIPPKLIKGVIALESQFWPNWEIEDEYGLAMVTEDGVDMLLKWNRPYFYQKCTDLYDEKICARGYFKLYDDQIQHLIGYVLQDVGSDQEYTLIAEILNAASMQAAQVVYNYTRKSTNAVTDFETLWRITLGIYHAGCGCMGNAIEDAWKESRTTLTWQSISKQLKGDCAGAKDYFDRVLLLSR